jgi:hypothetical protein
MAIEKNTPDDTVEASCMDNYKSKWQQPFDFRSLPNSILRDSIKIYKSFDGAMDIFNNRFLVAGAGSKSLIYDTKEYRAKKSNTLTAYTHNEFLLQFGHKTYPKLKIKKGKPAIEEVSLAREWKSHRDRRQYGGGVIFYPGDLSEKEKGEYYNTWKGFAVSPKQGEFPLLEKHLRHIWCNDNDEYYNYLIAWLADLIQNPHRKNNIAIVIKGEEGTGKSLVFEKVLAPILGKTYIKLDRTEHVTGKFNQHLYGRLLLVLEEAVWAGDKASESALKSMISDKDFVIEKKGIDSETSESYFRLAFLSNEVQAVPASIKARRYFALKTSEEERNKREYFDPLLREVENPETHMAFLHYLMEYDLSKIDIRTPPKTKALSEDIFAKMNSVWRWSYDLLYRNKIYSDAASILEIPIWNKGVENGSLFADYQRWLAEAKRITNYIPISDITSRYTFIQEFNRIFEFRSTQVNKNRALVFPSRDDARRIFASKINAIIEWLPDGFADDDAPDNDIWDELEGYMQKK